MVEQFPSLGGNLRLQLGRHRAIYLALARRRRLSALTVGPATELVIEGFPRSGNTFAVLAFECAQAREVRIAHHHHCAAQVLEGVRRGVPAIVLLRHPVQAAASVIVRHPELSARFALRWYAAFYEPLLSVINEIVVAPFDVVISDFGRIIDNVNTRFHTDYRRFEHTPSTVAAVFARVREAERRAGDSEVDFERRVAAPSEVRKTFRAAAEARIRAQGGRHLGTCEALHDHLLERATEHATGCS